MTRKLEEEFNLPHMDEMEESSESTKVVDLQEIDDAITLSEKINNALAEVRGMEVHDGEMDEIAKQAVESYEQLMTLGMNMTDMAAGPVFNNAANMLKIALEAKDSKVTRKLKQVDLMLKKANLDARKAKDGGEPEEVNATILDRNELLKVLGERKTNDK